MREQAVGEASGPAEAFGIRPGMPLSEALGRCPQLVLQPPDPGRTASAWERILRRLEAIGAEVESNRAGEAFFAVDGAPSDDLSEFAFSSHEVKPENPVSPQTAALSNILLETHSAIMSKSTPLDEAITQAEDRAKSEVPN